MESTMVIPVIVTLRLKTTQYKDGKWMVSIKGEPRIADSEDVVFYAQSLEAAVAGFKLEEVIAYKISYKMQ